MSNSEPVLFFQHTDNLRFFHRQQGKNRCLSGNTKWAGMPLPRVEDRHEPLAAKSGLKQAAVTGDNPVLPRGFRSAICDSVLLNWQARRRQELRTANLNKIVEEPKTTYRV